MKISETSTLLQVSIVFELKNEFRNTFKTAKWNPSFKTWDVANTTANKNKLAKFQAALDSTRAEEAITLQADAEMTQIEYNNLVATFKAKEKELDDVETIQNRHMQLKLKLDAKQALLDEKNKEAKAKLETLELTRADNNSKLLSILENYKYDDYSVIEAIALGRKYFNYIHSGHRDNVDKFYEVQHFLNDTYESIKESHGITFKVLKECYTANKNRYDRDYHWFNENPLDPIYVEFTG